MLCGGFSAEVRAKKMRQDGCTEFISASLVLIICGNPNYLAAALEKIEYYAVHGAPLPEATPETAHMCIINPFSGHDFSFKSLFSTHPATAERIARLREQAQRMHIR